MTKSKLELAQQSPIFKILVVGGVNTKVTVIFLLLAWHYFAMNDQNCAIISGQYMTKSDHIYTMSETKKGKTHQKIQTGGHQLKLVDPQGGKEKSFCAELASQEFINFPRKKEIDNTQQKTHLGILLR